MSCSRDSIVPANHTCMRSCTKTNTSMSKRKLKNVLPNSYKPVLSSKITGAVLSRLSKASLAALLHLWPALKNTQPQITNSADDQQELNTRVRDEARSIKADLLRWRKSQLIEKILFDFWPKGLNLLQLAQIDCQLLVDNPNAFTWVLSTAKDAWGSEVALSLDPALFLARLARQLSEVFMSYIYICRHPTMPIVVIRIQVFDLQAGTSRAGAKRRKTEKPHITSHKPYFLAIPMNSPHILHSPGSDLVAQTVLLVVQSCLLEPNNGVIRLETPRNQKGVKSLETMHVLKGVSRFAQSLGAWTPYADGTVDASPLLEPENHQIVQQREETFTSEEDRVRKLANARFKGSTSGAIKSDFLFEVPKLRTQKKPLVLNDEFKSLAPVQFVLFEIQNPLGDDVSDVRISFSGNDVFGGLHELATETRNPVVNPKDLPGWLTGEEGLSSGVVKGNVFTAKREF